MKSKHTAPPTASAGDSAAGAQTGGTQKSTGNGLTLVALALALAGVGGAWYTHSSLSSRLGALQSEMGSRIDTATSETASSIASLGESLNSKLDTVAERASELEAAGTTLDNRASELETRAGDLGTALDDTRSSVEATREALAQATEDLNQSISSSNQAFDDSLQAQAAELNTALDTRTSELDSLLQARSAEFTSLLETRSDEITGLVETRTGELNDSLQATQMKINRNQRAWLLSEVEYLLRTSVHRVVLAGDTNSAVEALKAAKEQLKVLAEVEYLPVQRAISAEITELRSADQPDIEQLIVDIRTLSRAAGNLRMPGNDSENGESIAAQSDTDQGESSDTGDSSGIGTLAANLLESLKQNVSIKTSGGSQFGAAVDGVFRATEEESTNAELVRLNLQAAQLSAMRRDQQGFDTHMNNARNRVTSLFDPAHNATQTFISELDLLAEVSVVPRAEQLGTALRLLVETNTKIGDQS
ncbi:MAG: uroporphyrinogen-III C-methyltransferase [Pseudomonadota bacterium]